MKATRIATIALCAVLMVLPSLAIPFFQDRDAGAENRYLADFPALTDGEGGINGDYAGEFEAWLSDHFGFRDAAVRLDALMNYRLLRTSPNADVIVGSGDWLYYAETAADYTGEGALSDAELDGIRENLCALSEALSENGARLYVAIVPNKNTVYPQYMPKRYAMRRDEGNIPRLERACEGLDLTWIDLLTPLTEAAEGDEPVYLKTDTHWNALGARIAADAVLDAMDRRGATWLVQGQASFSEGDLARLMGLNGKLSEIAPVVSMDAEAPEGDFSQHLLTAGGDGDGRLLVYRDSFGTAIGPYLAQAYDETELRWETPLNAARPCDDALVLICERNIRLYLGEAPLLDDVSEGADVWDDAESFDGFDFEDIDGDDDFFADDGGDDWEDFDEEDPDDGFFLDDEDDA